MTYLSVLPAHTTYIMTYMTHTFIKYMTQNLNLSNLQHFCVWKHVFWVDETLENLIQNSSKHALRSAATSQCFFFLRPTPQIFGLRRPREATWPVGCFCFCFLFRQDTIAGTSVFCFVLLTQGRVRLVALGSSPELSAFTMSLAPRKLFPVSVSVILSTDLTTLYGGKVHSLI